MEFRQILAPQLNNNVDGQMLVVRKSPIYLSSGTIETKSICQAAINVNTKLVEAKQRSEKLLNIYQIIDLRMLSGLIGEMFTTELAEISPYLIKNPNIDGYPDLCDISITDAKLELSEYISFPGGGLEIKNTFGVKKSGVLLEELATRRQFVNRQLVWKAHHPYTNNLIAIQSDFIQGIPQIVAGFYSNELNESDWSAKQNPKLGSTMTSFCATTRSAFEKLNKNPIFGFPEYLGN